MFDEDTIIKNIIIGADWQEVITTLVVDEGMDPMSVDIIKLTDTFTNYLQRLQKFDFHIPARFILIAAILLRMKCELLLEEEEKKEAAKGEGLPPIDINQVPELSPPIKRKPTRKVTLTELISALNKAFEFKDKKEERILRIRKAAEDLIEYEEDIESRIEKIYDDIKKAGVINFSDLVPVWKRIEIVKTFVPLLHLIGRDLVHAEQTEMFKEIHITLKDFIPAEKVEERKEEAKTS